MSGVFIEMSMSLDGYVAGANDSDVNPKETVENVCISGCLDVMQVARGRA